MTRLPKILAGISSGISFLLIASSVYAQGKFTPPKGSVATNVDPEKIPQLIVNLIFGLATFLAIVYLMYGGIRYMTSKGDKVAVEDARKHILSAVIGLVVVAGTFFILQVLFTVLGADNPIKNGFKLPTLKDVGK